jgi:hypothetical protein
MVVHHVRKLLFWTTYNSLLRAPDASSPNPSTSHGMEIPDDVPEGFHVARQVRNDTYAAVHAGYMEVFSIVKLL